MYGMFSVLVIIAFLGNPMENDQTSVVATHRPMDHPMPAPCANPGAGPRSVAAADGLPDVLRPSRVTWYRDMFRCEYNPVGPTEWVLVDDLARHAAAMELWAEGVGAVERITAQQVPGLLLAGAGDGLAPPDVAMAAAVSAAGTDRGERHGGAHSRGFYRALRTLLDLQAKRKTGGADRPIRPPNHFPTEAACAGYLRQRFEQGYYRCPRCGGRHGHFLKSRGCWECCGCKRQAGLRSGTVAADSPLPLVVWFAAIQLLLWKPALGMTELANELGIRRSATVRRIRAMVSAAMAAENASELLAGLDAYYAQCGAALPEPGAPEDKKMRPGDAGPSEDGCSSISRLRVSG